MERHSISKFGLMLIALCLNRPSQAFQIEDHPSCRSEEEIASIMNGEGVKKIIEANDDNFHEARYIYLNRESGLGYLVLSDQLLGSPIRKCGMIKFRFDRSVLPDPRRSGVASEVKVYDFLEYSAKKECKSVSENCYFHNERLEELNQIGGKVLFQGRTIFVEGNEAAPITFTLVALLNSSSGGALFTDGEGAMVQNTAYAGWSSIRYTSDGLKMLSSASGNR